MTKKSTNSDVKPAELLAAIRERGRRGLTAKQLVNQMADDKRVDRSEARRLLRPALKQLEQDGRVVLGRGWRTGGSNVKR